MKILIAGFSGAGKSTLIHSLKNAKIEELAHVDDLDEIVLMSCSKKYHSLAELIEKEGWEKFRLWERQAIEAWLKEEGHGVLALGGGSLSDLLLSLYLDQRNVKFCFLSIPFEVAWNRMVNDSLEKRPLTMLGKNKLEQIYQQRTELFAKIPWILNGEDPVEENCLKIIKSMSLHPFST